MNLGCDSDLSYSSPVSRGRLGGCSKPCWLVPWGTKGSAYACFERTKKADCMGELPGLRGANHAHFSAFVEVVLPNPSWEMASKLCDSKNKG